MCQISDLLLDVPFLICLFHLSKCDITRPPNFGKFEEFCNETFQSDASDVKDNLFPKLIVEFY